MKRDGNANYCISSFRKYIKQLGLFNVKPKNRRRKYTTGLRASKPKEIIQMDYTIFKTIDNQSLYLSLIIDNFSRKILGFKTSKRPLAIVALSNLKGVIEKFNLNNLNPLIRLIVDGGSENNNNIVDDYCSLEQINKQIAQKDIIFSNSMIEAVNSNLKYRFLYHHHFLDYNHFNKKLPAIIDDYNNRPFHPLNGLTPNEVFKGMNPNNVDYSIPFQKAKKDRITENQRYNCLLC